MKRLKYQSFLILCFCVVFTDLTMGQDNCDCDPVVQVNVCYIDRAQYCLGNESDLNCGMTFGHPNQIDGIQSKLTNPINFGPGGIVECTISPVSISEIFDKSDIYNSNCDVFYVGHFPQGFDFDTSVLPDYTLQAINEWSLDCSRNLAIVPQVEASLWGYQVENLNENPNFEAEGSVSIFALYDGPFGVVNEINQGGFYQGVVTSTPSTGHLVLAKDANERPTIAYDVASGDIIVGDIGLFMANNQGDITEGGEVINDNDRFACNIFALACNLVDEYLFVNEQVRLCDGDTFTLPNNEIVDSEGNHLDTIIVTGGCDTIINTIITIDIFEESITYSGCIDDGYFIQVGSEVYNQNNTSGVEVLTSVTGCDSTVVVDLTFSENSEFNFTEILCVNGTENFFINGTSYNIDNPSGTEVLINSVGCDSIVNINLEYTIESTFASIEDSLCETSQTAYIVNGVVYGVNNLIGTEVITNAVGCDSIITIDLEVLSDSESSYAVEVCPNSELEYTVNGVTYNVDNPIGQEVISNVQGCDSIIDIFFDVLPAVQSLLDTSICANDFSNFEINGTAYGLLNPYGQEIIQSFQGCDSTITIMVSAIELDTQYLDVAICADAEIVYNDVTYNIGDTYNVVNESNVGCDIVTQYNIVLDEFTPIDFDTTILIDLMFSNSLDLNLQNVQEVQWLTDEGLSCQSCEVPSITPSLLQDLYQVEVTNVNLCEYTIDVYTEFLNPPFIPNIFSPSSYGVNSYFNIQMPDAIYQYDIGIQNFMIFDRWGNLIRSITNQRLDPKLELWDGTFNDEDCEAGVYVYSFQLAIPNGQIYNYKGDVTLIR